MYCEFDAANERLYIMLQANGAGPDALQVWDISDPTAPSLIGTQTLTQGFQLRLIGGDLYVVTGIVDALYSFTAPGLVALDDESGDQLGVGEIESFGSYAVAGAVSGNGALNIWDISTPSAIGAKSTYVIPSFTAGNPFARIVKLNSTALLAKPWSGGRLARINMTTPTAPSVTWNVVNGAAGGKMSIDASGAYAVAAGGGLGIYDVSNGDLIARCPDFPGYEVDVAGDYAFGGANDGRISLVDLRDPTMPRDLGWTYAARNASALVQARASETLGIGCVTDAVNKRFRLVDLGI